jgi:hypothetical protein
VRRVEASTELFHILNELEVDSFDAIARGDESWFQYPKESSAMFVKSPHDVTRRTRPGIGVKKTMFTIFFTNRKLLIAEHLLEGQKYNQDYFCARMEHSKSHDRAKIQGKFNISGLGRSPHPPSSPDLSPYDFWLFGMATGEMKDREFHTVQDIRRCLTEICNGLDFKDVQSVFLEWKIGLNWVIENGGEHYRE